MGGWTGLVAGIQFTLAILVSQTTPSRLRLYQALAWIGYRARGKRTAVVNMIRDALSDRIPDIPDLSHLDGQIVPGPPLRPIPEPNAPDDLGRLIDRDQPPP